MVNRLAQGQKIFLKKYLFLIDYGAKTFQPGSILKNKNRQKEPLKYVIYQLLILTLFQIKSIRKMGRNEDIKKEDLIQAVVMADNFNNR